MDIYGTKKKILKYLKHALDVKDTIGIKKMEVKMIVDEESQNNIKMLKSNDTKHLITIDDTRWDMFKAICSLKHISMRRGFEQSIDNFIEVNKKLSIKIK